MKLTLSTKDERTVLRVENDGGRVTAQLYLKPNGNLYEDSWIAPMGWMENMPVFGEPPELGGDPMPIKEEEDGK